MEFVLVCVYAKMTCACYLSLVVSVVANLYDFVKHEWMLEPATSSLLEDLLRRMNSSTYT